MLFKQRLIFAHVMAQYEFFYQNLHDKFITNIINDNAVLAFVYVHLKILPK